jgi:hypothetical protein
VAWLSAAGELISPGHAGNWPKTGSSAPRTIVGYMTGAAGAIARTPEPGHEPHAGRPPAHTLVACGFGNLPIGRCGAPRRCCKLKVFRTAARETAMTPISKMVSLLAISAALAFASSHLFAKSAGGPGKVNTSTISAPSSAAPSGAGDSVSKGHGGTDGHNCGHACPPRPRPGYSQPPCRGPHMGPNGVMIQCD